MGTEVATKSRTELAQESAYDPFATAANDLAGSSAIYAKFNGNSGEFSYGSSAEEIEVGETMAANVAGMRRGWICWKDSEVVDEIMVPIVEGQPPRKDQLPDHGPYDKHEDGTEDGWSEQIAIDLRLLGEDHDGAEILYKTTTKSAHRPLGDLLKDYSRQYKNYPGQIPIVEFDKGSYMPKEKKHGKKYFPKFKIVDWISEDDLIAQYGDGSTVGDDEENDNLIEDKTEETPAEKPKPAKADKKTKAPEPEPDPEPEAQEEDDEVAALKAKLAALEAGKKAAAEESEPDPEPAEKPKPAGGNRARRRSF